MKIQDKMKRDWDRRASVDAHYWVAATQEADLESYERSAQVDTEALIEGLKPHIEALASGGRGRSALDLGCGIGRMTSLLTPHFERVVGVDVSELMIERARELHSAGCSAEGGALSFELNSGTDLSAFAPASFELVCSYSVLAHLPTDVVAAYFVEVNRVLEEGGYFRYQFWVCAEPEGAIHPSDDNSLNIHVYDEAHFQQLHAEAGFEVIDRQEIDYLDPVLNLKPVWVTARKERSAEAGASQLDREVSEELSEDELRMEYELLLYLSVKHLEREEGSKAEQVLERATHLAPAWPEAYLQWVELRLQQDDLSGVTMLLEELLKHCPEHIQARLFLAQISVASEDFITGYKQLDELGPLLLKTPEGLSAEELEAFEEARLLYLGLLQEAEVGRVKQIQELARLQRAQKQAAKAKAKPKTKSKTKAKAKPKPKPKSPKA